MENILGTCVKARWSAASSGRRVYVGRAEILLSEYGLCRCWGIETQHSQQTTADMFQQNWNCVNCHLKAEELLCIPPFLVPAQTEVRAWWISRVKQRRTLFTGTGRRCCRVQLTTGRVFEGLFSDASVSLPDNRQNSRMSSVTGRRYSNHWATNHKLGSFKTGHDYFFFNSLPQFPARIHSCSMATYLVTMVTNLITSENQNDFFLRSFTTDLICSWVHFCGRITTGHLQADTSSVPLSVSQRAGLVVRLVVGLVVGLVDRYSHVFRSDTNFQTLFCFCSCCWKCSFILHQTGIMDVTTRWRLS